MVARPAAINISALLRSVRASFVALAKLLYFRPIYLFTALAVSVIFYELIFWSLNLGLLHYLLTTKFLSFSDKLDVVIGSYSDALSLPLSSITTVLFVVSILQGVTVAAIIYTIRHNRATNRNILKNVGGTGAAGMFSLLGLGCIPCGTSLVTPILTFFFATSSAVVAEKIGFYSAILALVVSVLAAYFAGSKLSQVLRV